MYTPPKKKYASACHCFRAAQCKLWTKCESTWQTSLQLLASLLKLVVHLMTPSMSRLQCQLYDDYWLRSSWAEHLQQKPKKPLPSATLSTTNPTQLNRGSILGYSDGKPAINRLTPEQAGLHHLCRLFHRLYCSCLFLNTRYRLSAETVLQAISIV
jgi:hypothetical protein